LKRELTLVVAAAVLGVVGVTASGSVDLMLQSAEPATLAAEVGRAQVQKAVTDAVDPMSTMITFLLGALVSVAAYVLALRRL
jgi:hypothetical protein